MIQPHNNTTIQTEMYTGQSETVIKILTTTTVSTTVSNTLTNVLDIGIPIPIAIAMTISKNHNVLIIHKITHESKLHPNGKAI